MRLYTLLHPSRKLVLLSHLRQCGVDALECSSAACPRSRLRWINVTAWSIHEFDVAYTFNVIAFLVSLSSRILKKA